MNDTTQPESIVWPPLTTSHALSVQSSVTATAYRVADRIHSLADHEIGRAAHTERPEALRGSVDVQHCHVLVLVEPYDLGSVHCLVTQRHSAPQPGKGSTTTGCPERRVGRGREEGRGGAATPGRCEPGGRGGRSARARGEGREGRGGEGGRGAEQPCDKRHVTQPRDLTTIVVRKTMQGQYLRSEAPLMTWKLVTMFPLASQMNPDPDPCGTSRTSRVKASLLQNNHTPRASKDKQRLPGRQCCLLEHPG